MNSLLSLFTLTLECHLFLVELIDLIRIVYTSTHASICRNNSFNIKKSHSFKWLNWLIHTQTPTYVHFFCFFKQFFYNASWLPLLRQIGEICWVSQAFFTVSLIMSALFSTIKRNKVSTTYTKGVKMGENFWHYYTLKKLQHNNRNAKHKRIQWFLASFYVFLAKKLTSFLGR